jgi:glutamate-1-semialdehyde 2,1-aminomutase
MTGGPVQTFRDARRADSVLQQGLFLGLLNEGVMLAPRGMGSLSTQTTALHVDHLVDAVGRVISILCSGGAAPRAGG